ncbi:hypothetical protein LJC27_04160 [Christensenellaceae bacterium OttesenSCG-928-M15]|nr:hypothetical protein [Christensenellaceae bacterium OttesenSCG-928-M15]
MSNCLIWGTGFRGKECLSGIQTLESSLRVFAFVDNDASIWHKEVCGLPVLPPSKIKEEAFDKIIVCAKQGVEAIRTQLINQLHVPAEKIIRYRIDPLPIRFEANAEDVYLAQLGEFGYEMVSWIPYLTYLRSQGIRLKTIGRKGSSVFYESISEEHIEVGDEYIGHGGMGDLDKIEKLKRDLGLPIFGPCKETSGFEFCVNGVEWQVHDIHADYPVKHLKKPDFPLQNILDIKGKKSGYRGMVTINNKNYVNSMVAGLIKNYFVSEELAAIVQFLRERGFFVVYNDSSVVYEKKENPIDGYVSAVQFETGHDSVLNLQDYSDGTEDKWDRMQLECWQNSDFVIQSPGGAAAVVELLGVRKFNLMRKGDYQDDLYLSKLYGGQSDTFYEVRHMLAYMEKEFDFGRL